MLDVEIMPIQDSLVLRARGSELLILPTHITALKTKSEPRDFARYFLEDALINRPARKLFLAWLRKDNGLWRKIFDTVKEMEVTPEGETKEASPKAVVPKTISTKHAVTKHAAPVSETAKPKKEAKAPKVEAKETKEKETKKEPKKKLEAAAKTKKSKDDKPKDKKSAKPAAKSKKK